MIFMQPYYLLDIQREGFINGQPMHVWNHVSISNWVLIFSDTNTVITSRVFYNAYI